VRATDVRATDVRATDVRATDDAAPLRGFLDVGEPGCVIDGDARAAAYAASAATVNRRGPAVGFVPSHISRQRHDSLGIYSEVTDA
jgi:hypothetical protein